MKSGKPEKRRAPISQVLSRSPTWTDRGAGRCLGRYSGGRRSRILAEPQDLDFGRTFVGLDPDGHNGWRSVMKLAPQ